MKKLLLLGVGSALMFTMAGVGSAQADTDGTNATQQIHKVTSVATGGGAMSIADAGARCAGCHRAHTAKAEKLLTQAQPALCYTCHGSLGSYLNVVDGVAAGSTTVALRGGGFENAVVDGANATLSVTTDATMYGGLLKTGNVPTLTTGGTAVTSRHQIDGTTQGVMWGNGAVSATTGGALDAGKAGVTLECGSCHDPHGNGNYRILKPIPNDAATTAVTTWTDPAGVVHNLPYTETTTPFTVHNPVAAVVVAPVAIPDVPQGTTRSYTTTNYWMVDDRSVPPATGGTVDTVGVTDGYIANVSQWCTTCHTRYLAGSGSYKTPLTGLNAAGGSVVDATFTYRHRSDATDYAVGKTPHASPNCIQCHVSHGSNVSMTGWAAQGTDGQGLLNPAGVLNDGAVMASGVDNSRLLRVDNRGTCQMCHNK